MVPSELSIRRAALVLLLASGSAPTPGTSPTKSPAVRLTPLDLKDQDSDGTSSRMRNGSEDDDGRKARQTPTDAHGPPMRS